MKTIQLTKEEQEVLKKVLEGITQNSKNGELVLIYLNILEKL